MNPLVVQTALILAGISVVVLFNERGFAGLSRRIDDLRSDMDHRFAAVDQRFAAIERVIEADLREMFKNPDAP